MTLPFMRNKLNIQRKSISRFGGLNRTDFQIVSTLLQTHFLLCAVEKNAHFPMIPE